MDKVQPLLVHESFIPLNEKLELNKKLSKLSIETTEQDGDIELIEGEEDVLVEQELMEEDMDTQLVQHYIPKDLRRRIHALEELSIERQELQREYRAQVKALDLKFEELHAPIYDARKAIIMGTAFSGNVVFRYSDIYIQIFTRLSRYLQVYSDSIYIQISTSIFRYSDSIFIQVFNIYMQISTSIFRYSDMYKYIQIFIFR